MKNSKKKLHAPKRSGLIYLCLIGSLVFILLAVFIPLSIIKEYNENKVTPYADKISTTDYESITLSDITDFNFIFYCSEYKDGVSATFTYYTYKNTETEALPSNIRFELAMCSNWINLNQTASSRSVTLYDNEEKGLSGARTVTINSLPDLPAKTSIPFYKIETINLYMWLTYDTKLNGKTTSHTYLVTIPYSEYIVGAVGGIEK